MALPGEIDVEVCPECGRTLKLQVLQSGAGYYIGTQCDDDGPISRESEYFQSYGAAAATLEMWKKGVKHGKRDTEYHPEHEPSIIEFQTEKQAARSRQAIIDTGSNEPSDSLNVDHLNNVMTACLYPDNTTRVDEPTILVQGIVHSFAFRASRVEDLNEEIHQMLLELPEEFREGPEGGGWSFINMALTKDGHQWGEQSHSEALMCLGLATGWLSMPLSRAMWMLLPGAVPYLVVRNERQHVEVADEEAMAEINRQYARQEGLDGGQD